MHINNLHNYNSTYRVTKKVENDNAEISNKNISDTDLKVISDATTAIGKASINFCGIKSKIAPEVMNTIIELFKNGESVKNIVIAVGGIVSVSHIYTLLKDLDNYEELKASRTTDTNEKLLELYTSGVSIGEISNTLGIHRDTVRNRLNKFDNIEEIENLHNASLKGKRQHLTEKDKQAIIELYKQGLTMQQIDKKLKCASKKLLNKYKDTPEWEEIKKTHDENYEKTQGIMPQDKTDIALKLYKEGKSFNTISKTIGITAKTISDLFKLRPDWSELKEEHDKNLSNFDDDKILELYKEGYTYEKIAKEFNCSISCIKKRIHQHPNGADAIAIHNEVAYKKTVAGNEELQNKIIQLYREGKSYAQIYEILNCTYTTIGKVLKNAPEQESLNKEHFKNLKRKDINTKINEETSKKIITLYKNKVSLLKIALETGYTPAIIQRHLQEQKDWESLKTNHNKKIDDKTLEKIIEDYKKGVSLAILSEKYNYNHTTIGTTIKKLPNGEKIRKEHFNIQLQQKLARKPIALENIINDYIAGYTFIQLAQKYNYSPVTIFKHIKKHSDTNKLREIHNQNYARTKENSINDIVQMHKNGHSYKDIQKKYGYTELGIKRIIKIVENKLKFAESLKNRYDSYNLDDLQNRIVEFFINNTTTSDSLENIIDFLDTNSQYFTESNKNIIIGFCRDLDKIEKTPTKAEEIINTSQYASEIIQWIDFENKLDSDFEKLNTAIADTILLLQKNQLIETCELLEPIIPDNKNQIEKIEIFRSLLNNIQLILSKQNVTIKDKKYINNVINYYYYIQSKDTNDTKLLTSALNIYNKLYDDTLTIENLKATNDNTKEKLGQILHIEKLLDEDYSTNTDFDNEFTEFVDIFKGKNSIRSKAIIALVNLENYFNSTNSQKYLLKNFEPIAKECILDETIIKIFMEKLYKFEYKNIGPDKISLNISPTVLRSNIWQKRLNQKEKLDFIKTMENGILDLNPRSKGRINIIKGEGKIDKNGKKYQLIELKIDSQWRIFGYQDPNNKIYVFDTIDLDDGGIDNYKKNFFKTHNL